MPAKAPERHNHLPNAAYVLTDAWRGTMTTKQFRETIAATDGWVMAAGDVWDICSRPRGGGMVSVRLERR